MVPVDSGYQIALSTSFGDVLNVFRGLSILKSKNANIRPDSAISSQPGMLWQNRWQYWIQRVKYVHIHSWKTSFRQVEPLWHGIVKNSEIGLDSHDISTTRGAMER